MRFSVYCFDIFVSIFVSSFDMSPRSNRKPTFGQRSTSKTKRDLGALALVKGNREPHEVKKKSFDLGGN